MQLHRLKALAWSALIVAQLSCSNAALAERVEPNEWLNRMGAAVQTTSYEGTVIRIQNGKAEALKVVHTVSDGDGLEIIRNGNEVHCILPDRKSVLVEEWDDQSTLFSTLPSSDVRFGSEYDVSIIREERVAGRRAVLIAIRPHDDYRYGHRLWLDLETAFPLQTKLVGDDGSTLEQVKFADIKLNQPIALSALAPSVNTENYRWLTQPSRHISHDIETPWRSDDLPPGFRALSTHGEKMPGSDEVTTHILFSDGLANVSVFVAPADQNTAEGPSRVSGSNSYSALVDGYRVTAVGEVPAMTVRQIATTMTLR